MNEQTVHVEIRREINFPSRRFPNLVFHFGDEVPIESLTLMLGGLIVPALFSDGYFSLDKGVWRS